MKNLIIEALATLLAAVLTGCSEPAAGPGDRDEFAMQLTTPGGYYDINGAWRPFTPNSGTPAELPGTGYRDSSGAQMPTPTVN